MVLGKTTDEVVKALCTGEAGIGKTTLAKRLAWLWASKKTSSRFWSRIKAVIFVRSRDNANSLKELIRNSIPGEQHEKDAIMDLLENEPESVLVIVDEFDECRDSRVITEIKQMIKDKVTNVFITMRKNDQQLTKEFTCLFNEQYEINGFDLESSTSYVKQLFKEQLPPYDAKEFLQTISGKPKFETNPSHLLLAYELYMSSDIQTLTAMKLYFELERKIVSQDLRNKSLYQISEETNKIQNLALYCLLRGNSQCSLLDLHTYKIDLASPAMVLLDKCSGEEELWTWQDPHHFQYDVAVALARIASFRNSLWLCWIASRPDLNSLRELLSNVLGSTGKYADVKSLTTATIILQSRARCSAPAEQAANSDHPCHWIDRIKEMITRQINIETCFSDGEYTPHKVHIEIPSLESLTKCCGSLYTDNVSLFKHVQECWKLGLSTNPDTRFVAKCHEILLPAFDRYVSINSMTQSEHTCMFDSVSPGKFHLSKAILLKIEGYPQ